MPFAQISVNPTFTVGPVNRRLFGGFVEHLGRHIYDGIYEPSHPSADADGFRQDVIDLVRELGVSTIRYPGGNFVSGLNWRDTVGPRTNRPRRLDLAWHSTEPNEVGMHEFQTWLDKVGSELMLAVNLGTRGIPEALELLEYANIPGGTALSEERSRNGRRDPFDVRMWCLGNEMDGPWQLGHKDAESYGALAAGTARAMRQLDPNIELVASGSSGRWMPTFGSWERIVLEHTYDEVDFISCHAYYEETDGDVASFLASGVDMDRFIESVISTADHVKAVKRSDKTLHISFDEWNVWYQSRYDDHKAEGIGNWPVAARLLEDTYTVTDAVVVGGLLISLLKHADRVQSASIAQLVNVIAPIMTEPGGPAWRQTTFFPFARTAALASGTSLRPVVDAPLLQTTKWGEVPALDAAVTQDGTAFTIFVLNRDEHESIDTRIALGATLEGRTVTAAGIWDDDRHAANVLGDTDRVSLRSNLSASLDGDSVTIQLPPVSWTAIEIR